MPMIGAANVDPAPRIGSACAAAPIIKATASIMAPLIFAHLRRSDAKLAGNIMAIPDYSYFSVLADINSHPPGEPTPAEKQHRSPYEPWLTIG
ncbi:hypothetical protein MES4922_590027 [Mesorhizobium ventifaucium]|uniref:Uncharacterized protein n=1 Tax=Mesorhizobium ventifaucium TaxID=666020 RepID=A0ABM9EC90_9HYPH|nr:hypothetical protein MES4922_590027 [Mesorhizobium ventifaucium]